MKGSTMLAMLQKLGVAASFSRPGVSDDNPHIESIFRTMKYRPEYPSDPFASLEAASAWVDSFCDWYNFHHRHSSIGFVTPDQRHQGVDVEILKRRAAIYEAARRRNPQRWSRGCRSWARVASVTLNPRKGAGTEAVA
jgi:hypothetical protein